MHAYVINLRRRPDRREQFLRWNSDKGLTFEFLDAVDGQQLSRSDLLARNLLSPEDDRFKGGSIGNALSHRTIWEMAQHKNENAIVFEDDAFIHSRAAILAGRQMGHLASGVDLLYLGYNRDATLSIRYAPGAWSVIRFNRVKAGFDDFSEAYDALGHRYEPRTYDVRLIWEHSGTSCRPGVQLSCWRKFSRCRPMLTSSCTVRTNR
jgi:hypothetical protein